MQPPSLDPSPEVYHREGTRSHLTETEREKRTAVSSLPTLGFGQEAGAVRQADVENPRKENLPPQSPWKALDPLSGNLSGPRDGHTEVHLELRVGEAVAALVFLLSPAVPGSCVVRMRPGSPCGFVRWDSGQLSQHLAHLSWALGGEGSGTHCRGARSGGWTGQARGPVEGAAATEGVGWLEEFQS